MGCAAAAPKKATASSTHAPCKVCEQLIDIHDLSTQMRNDLCRKEVHTQLVCPGCRSKGFEQRSHKEQTCSQCHQNCCHAACLCGYCEKPASLTPCATCTIPIEISKLTPAQRKNRARDGAKCHDCNLSARIKCDKCKKFFAPKSFAPRDLLFQRFYGLRTVYCRSCLPADRQRPR